MAPVIHELKKCKHFETSVCVTAQHREMLDQVLQIFNITPDFDLNIMSPRQTLDEVTSRVLMGLNNIMQQVKPDMVLVHGDTSTSFTASLAAFYHQISVGHVEAGCVQEKNTLPFPRK